MGCLRARLRSAAAGSSSSSSTRAARRPQPMYDVIRHMKRTTIFLDGGLERDLKLFAERQQRTTASVVREALAQWVEAQRVPPGRRPGFVKIGRSGRSDTAEDHEAL